MIKEDEFNSHLSETTNGKSAVDYNHKNEFDNPSTYSESDVPEVIQVSKEKSTQNILQQISTVAVVLVGGSLVGVTSYITITDSNHTEIMAIEVDENYAYFSFETTEENLGAKIYNDYENFTIDVEYADSSVNDKNETIYYGFGFCETLKANTNYYLSIEGSSTFGNSSRAKQKFKTSKKIEEDPPYNPPDSSDSSSSEPDIVVPWDEQLTINVDYSKVIEDLLVYQIDVGNEDKNNFSKFEFTMKGTALDPVTTQNTDYLETFTFNSWQETFELDFTPLETSYYLFSVTTYVTHLDERKEVDFQQFSPYAMMPTKPDDIYVMCDNERVNSENLLLVELNLENKMDFYKDFKVALTTDDNKTHNFIKDEDYPDEYRYKLDLTGEEKYLSGTLKAEALYQDSYHEISNQVVEIYHSSYTYEFKTDFGDFTTENYSIPITIEYYDYNNLYGKIYYQVETDLSSTIDKYEITDISPGITNKNIDLSAYNGATEIHITILFEYDGAEYSGPDTTINI